MSNRTAEKVNGNILLGVSLPYSELENKEALKIVQEFHKTYTLVGLISVLLMLPLLIISKYVSISILYILVWCCLVFYINYIIQKKYFNKLYQLKSDKGWFIENLQNSGIDTDESQFWMSGFYYNPNDKRVWVEKRFGIGTTTNMASWFGKLTYVFLAAIIIGTIALSIFLMPLDFGSVELEVKNNVVFINAPMYNDSFSLADIQVIKQVNDLPKMSKRYGGDSDNFYVGSFDVQGYNKCSVYVHRNIPPYIFVTLSDRIVILNGDTPEKTKSFYLLLTQ
jgi:hypothetical protein